MNWILHKFLFCFSYLLPVYSRHITCSNKLVSEILWQLGICSLQIFVVSLMIYISRCGLLQKVGRIRQKVSCAQVGGRFLSNIMKVCRQKSHHNSLCYLLRHSSKSRSLASIDSNGRVLKTHFWECQFLCLVFQLHDQDLSNAQAYVNFLYHIELSFSYEVTMTKEFVVVHEA